MDITTQQAPGGRPPRRGRGAVLAGLVATLVLAAVGCSSGGGTTDSAHGMSVISAVGAENEYANVLGQIGGRYVHVSAILDNPNTDPHTFEASPQVAQEVSSAQLIVQNGVGYDSWMNKIESASPNPRRKVITGHQVLGRPASTPNPHLWYDPGTMSKVAAAVAARLAAIQPGHAAYFKANAKTFTTSLTPWINAIGTFKQQHPGVPVATTEPVADYLLQALGADNKTPWAFQADVMNGTDPSAQDVAIERSLFTQHKVKAFVYNQQVTDSLTESFISLAHANGIPVVGVYETMPEPGYHYQSWMQAEVRALQKAVTSGVSSEHL
jgi:zinc/manganese transport system substrate-binding protein